MRTILYKSDQSPPARSVQMIIHILGLDFIEQRDLNPILREQDEPEMRKKNPMKTIPFIDEGDFSLGDSHAIVLYLLDKYGKPEHEHLYPKDKRKRATVNQRLFLDCGIVFQRLRVVMAGTYMGKMTELTREVLGGIRNAYGMLEAYLFETKYLADDVITVADICTISTMSSLDGLLPVDENRFPNLRRWLTIMNEEDFVRVANAKGAKDHAESLFAFMENNKHNQKSKI